MKYIEEKIRLFFLIEGIQINDFWIILKFILLFIILKTIVYISFTKGSFFHPTLKKSQTSLSRFVCFFQWASPLRSDRIYRIAGSSEKCGQMPKENSHESQSTFLSRHWFCLPLVGGLQNQTALKKRSSKYYFIKRYNKNKLKNIVKVFGRINKIFF